MRGDTLGLQRLPFGKPCCQHFETRLPTRCGVVCESRDAVGVERKCLGNVSVAWEF